MADLRSKILASPLFNILAAPLGKPGSAAVNRRLLTPYLYILVFKAGYGRSNGVCVVCEDGYYSVADQEVCIKCGDNNENTGGQTGSESSDACCNLLPYRFCSINFHCHQTTKIGAFRHEPRKLDRS